MTVNLDFKSYIRKNALQLTPRSVKVLQLNITKLCNQVCVHCHVDASPRRKESMSDAVIDRCIEIIKATPDIETVDLTGGAPELHPRFRELVVASKTAGKQVIVRHNLTVTIDPHPKTAESMEYLPEFFRAHAVEIISSLPCYSEANTDKQRGDGVFNKSIESLRRLNRVGFGMAESHLVLNLVYNPTGAFLPADQSTLEQEYKRKLWDDFNIAFNRLLTITNMPIHRFKAQLLREKKYAEYMELLVNSFNADAAKAIMCRDLISVSHDGKLYDCDFNQMLNMPVASSATIFDFAPSELLSRSIAFGEHCFGCTAGAGSSCGGAIS